MGAAMRMLYALPGRFVAHKLKLQARTFVKMSTVASKPRALLVTWGKQYA